MSEKTLSFTIRYPGKAELAKLAQLPEVQLAEMRARQLADAVKALRIPIPRFGKRPVRQATLEDLV
jgi:hypothetical protein